MNRHVQYWNISRRHIQRPEGKLISLQLSRSQVFTELECLSGAGLSQKVREFITSSISIFQEKLTFLSKILAIFMFRFQIW